MPHARHCGRHQHRTGKDYYSPAEIAHLRHETCLTVAAQYTIYFHKPTTCCSIGVKYTGGYLGQFFIDAHNRESRSQRGFFLFVHLSNAP